MRAALLLVACSLLACGSASVAADAPSVDVSSPPLDGGGGGGGGDEDAATSGDGAAETKTDAGGEVHPDLCDLTKPFGAPVPIGIAMNGNGEGIIGASMTADEKTFIVVRTSVTVTGGAGYVTYSRPTRTGSFGTPVPRPELSGRWDPRLESLWLSDDGLVAYVAGSVAEMSAQFDVKRISRFHRSALVSPFVRDGAPVPGLAPESGPPRLATPFVYDGESRMFFAKQPGTSFDRDLYDTSLTTPSPEPLDALNVAGQDEVSPVLSPDGLTLYFASSRSPDSASTRHQVYAAHRATKSAPFEAPEKLPQLVSKPLVEDVVPFAISKNGCRLYLRLDNEEARTSILAVASRP